MKSDGSDQTNITRTSTWEMQPAWSPDGRKIAFASQRARGNPDIYVMNADGTDVTRLTDNRSDGTDNQWPGWSPDGKRVVYSRYYQGAPYPHSPYHRGDVCIINAADGTDLINLNNTPLIADGLPSWQSPLWLVSESGTARAVALESVSFLRDPLPLNMPYNFSSDRRPRLTLFARSLILKAGENYTAVTARADDANGRSYQLPVEYVGKTPGFDWLTQIVIKLPEDLPAPQDLNVSVALRGSSSNKVVVKLK